jgi:anaerobic magnesium-protoporphyrin IX monomethyl ester cyclase
MEKILLLNPPGDKLYQRDMYCSAVSKANYYWPAIDLLILSGILGEKYDVHVLDAIAEKLNPASCLERIKQEDYKSVIFLTGTASWKMDLEFMTRIKAENKQSLLIGNGDILLYDTEEFMRKYSCLDAVLFDYTNTDILDFLGNKRDQISSMAFRDNGNIVIRKQPVRVLEFAYPVPHHQKFPLKKYLLVHGKRFPFTTVQTTFGCPFKCSFCVASTLGFKYRNVDNVMEELRYVSSLGIKEVFFTDFTFEARRENTLAICRKMIEERLDLTWVCSSRANTLDEELLALMKASGCHTILLGVESGDEGMLRDYSKGVTKDQMRKAFSLCNKLNIRTLGHFIIGLPGETEESVKKTIAFAKELDCDIASFNIAVPALGTPLRETALKQGWLTGNILEFDASDSFPVMETPTFSKQQAWKWRNRAVRKFYFRPSYWWKTAFSSRSFYQWKVLVLNGAAVVKNVFKKGKN